MSDFTKISRTGQAEEEGGYGLGEFGVGDFGTNSVVSLIIEIITEWTNGSTR